MRMALIITAKDLRQRLRDRSIIMFAVLAPLGLAVIFSMLLRGATSFHADYVVVDLDGGSLATTFTGQVLGGLTDAGVATIETRATEADARQAVEVANAAGWKADAAFVIPLGFSEAIAAGQPTSIVILGAKDAGLATEVARSVAARFADGVASVQLAVLTVGDLRGTPPAGADMAAIVAAAQQPAIALVDTGADLRQLSWATFFSSAMAVLFLFFAVQSGMLSLFEERRQGTLARMLAGPIRPGTILAGKALGSFVTGVASLVVLIVATTVMLGADWGPPPGVALIVVSAVISAIGITTLVTSFMKTADGAGAANVRGGDDARDPGWDVLAHRAGAGGDAGAEPGDAARVVPARPGRDAGRRHDRGRAPGGRGAAGDGPGDRGDRLRPGAATGGPAMSGIGKALWIGRTNLLRQVRDRGNLFFIFVLPTIIIVALGLQFGGSSYARLGVVAPDGDAAADALVVRIREDSPVFTIVTFADEASLRTAVERGTVEAGVVLPEDYGARLAGSDVVEIRFLGTTETITAGYRAAIEAAMAEQQALAAAARTAAKLGAGTFAEAYVVAEARRPDVAGVAVTVELVGAEFMFEGYSQFTFGAQTQLLLFTFLTSMTAAGQLVLTKRLGVSRRMVSTPTSVGTIVLGETLGRFLVALLQALFVVVLTATVFNVSWGDPLAASAIILLFCLVSAGAAMLVGAVSRNADQASSLGVFAGMALGALGGCMVPLAFMPEAMQTLAKLIPHSWAITALSSLVRDGGGIDSVLTNVVVLAGFAVVLLGLATWRFRKAITG